MGNFGQKKSCKQSSTQQTVAPTMRNFCTITKKTTDLCEKGKNFFRL